MRRGHERGEPRGVVAARLDGVQRLGLQRLVRRVARRRTRPRARRGPSSSSRTGPAMRLAPRRASSARGAEADDDVGHLHAGVVDVVLDLDGVAAVAQQRARSVSPRRGVAQVADVGGLVRVDAGVLDDHVPRARGRRRPARRASACSSRGEGAAVEEQVHVAAARDLGAPHARRARRARRRAARRSRAACGAASWRGRRGRSGPGRRARPAGGYWKDTARGIDVESGSRGLLYRPRKALLEIQDHSHQSYRARGGAYATFTSFDPQRRAHQRRAPKSGRSSRRPLQWRRPAGHPRCA